MKRVSGDKETGRTENEVFLVTAANEREYDVYRSLLEAYGIPFVKRSREAGGYLNISMGMNIYGVDIYVPEKHYKEASGLIRSSDGAETDNGKDDNDTEIETLKEQYQNRRLTYVWIIIAMFYFPFVIWLIYSLIKSI